MHENQVLVDVDLKFTGYSMYKNQELREYRKQ